MLYKYKSFSNSENLDYTIDSLMNKYLYFSRPSELNDPFDCQIQVDTNAKGRTFNIWRNEMIKESDVDKQFLTIDYTNQLFNDPKILNGMKTLTHLMVESNHLLSLTTDCLNESMWALYAGNYNGLCLGYNIDSNILSFLPKKVEFCVEEGEIITPSNNHDINFKQIEYDNNGKHIMKLFSSRASQIKEINYNLRHKKKCWISENEYRAIIHDADYEIFDLRKKIVKVFYDDNLLEEIIFGHQVSLATMKMIMNMIKTNYSNHVKFYRIKIDLEKYCLLKEEI